MKHKRKWKNQWKKTMQCAEQEGEEATYKSDLNKI
jgi:hypothetical protein